jgi:hypothetical protein
MRSQNTPTREHQGRQDSRLGCDDCDAFGGVAVEIVDKINAGLADPKMKARLADLGAKAFAGSASEFGKFIADETLRSNSSMSWRISSSKISSTPTILPDCHARIALSDGAIHGAELLLWGKVELVNAVPSLTKEARGLGGVVVSHDLSSHLVRWGSLLLLWCVLIG